MSYTRLMGWLFLIGFAAMTSWLLYSLEKHEVGFEDSRHQIPDYTLKGFTTVHMNEQGTRQSQLTAQHLKHYPNANTQLTAPNMIFYEQKQPIWSVESQRGEVSPDHNHIWLLGDTRWQRHPQPQITVLTENVHIQMDSQYAQTAAPTTILMPQGKTESIGMRLFLAQQQLELLSQVRGTYALH